MPPGKKARRHLFCELSREFGHNSIIVYNAHSRRATEVNDWRLLREYVGNGSETAFGQLVGKHMALVYWTCRRDLRDPQMAEDATQDVFLLLARKASDFSPRVSISGWLFQASRFVSRDLYRSEMRRQRHEETVQMREKEAMGSLEWREVDPWLNDSLSALKVADREAILMRYFEELSVSEVATALGTSETNARKRLSRAVDRLRGFLLKQGVGVSAIALASLLAEHPARAVPPALHSTTLSALSQEAGTLAASHFHALVFKKGAYLLMQTAKQKIVATAIVTAVIGALVTVPIAGWKIYHEKALAAEIGSGGFTDQSALPSSADAMAAHQEIVADYKAIVDGFNKRDFSSWVSSIAPDAVIKPGSGHVINRDQGIANDQQELASHPEAKITGTLRSLTINGDQAIGTFATRWTQTTTAQDMKAPGHLDVSDETFQMNWEKRAGKWLIVQSNIVSHKERVQ
jgi:RNA polymerase sigma factor (sigma-70 family)